MGKKLLHINRSTLELTCPEITAQKNLFDRRIKKFLDNISETEKNTLRVYLKKKDIPALKKIYLQYMDFRI